MNIFFAIGICALCALVPAAVIGTIFWAALRDGERLTLGEVPRGFFIRARHA